ncbi:VOC family protein [Niveibacterium sp. SC-1]|uniref:VOC family protein n=1 Tax=Niveibacterium sp. SC-1 TaxID=3135646 RepID=UPI0031203885
MAQLSTYLFFDGNCEEAMRFYAEALGGTVNMMMKHDELPPGETVPPGSENKVMHANITIPGGVLMASDAVMGDYQKMQGFYVALNFDTVEETQRAYTALTPGATIGMPLGKTFWSAAFSMFTDRFGTRWMVGCTQPG